MKPTTDITYCVVFEGQQSETDPITAGEVCRWISEGKLDRSSKVRVYGDYSNFGKRGAKRKTSTLGDLPEFAQFLRDANPTGTGTQAAKPASKKYFVQGLDQKEYGPITAKQVSRWISENRLNGSSPARADGDCTWKLIRDYPEFTQALGGSQSIINAQTRHQTTSDGYAEKWRNCITEESKKQFGIIAAQISSEKIFCHKCGKKLIIRGDFYLGPNVELTRYCIVTGRPIFKFTLDCSDHQPWKLAETGHLHSLTLETDWEYKNPSKLK